VKTFNKIKVKILLFIDKILYYLFKRNKHKSLVYKQIISDIPHAEIASIQRASDGLEYGGNSSEVINKMKALRKQYPLVEVYLPTYYNDKRRQNYFKNKPTYNIFSIRSSDFKKDLEFFKEFFAENGFYPTAMPPLSTHIWDDETETDIILNKDEFYKPLARKIDMNWLGQRESKKTEEMSLQLS